MDEIRLGSINGSHGIKGWVKVYSETDPISAITDYSPWTLRKRGSEKTVRVLDSQLSGKRLMVRIEGVDSRNASDELIGFEIFVPADVLPELEDGEYYWHQLEGLRVINHKAQVLGQLEHLLETGAKDVMVVRPSPDSIDDNERLIPYVEGEVVNRIDLDAGDLMVTWEADY